MMKRLFSILTVICLAAACSSDENEPLWVDSGREINRNYADVVWFSGALFKEVEDADGNPSCRIELDEEQKEIFRSSVLKVRDRIFPDSLNFFAPYYRQFTMSAIDLPEDKFDSLYNVVADEAYEAFQFYIKNLNKGRPYVLAGMSEGGMMVSAILKRMSDDEHANFVAAYSIGYGVSLSDMIYRFVRPAKGATDKGVIVSFNSVQSPKGIWPFVLNNSYAVINPVTWKTDGTTGHFVYKGDSLSVRIDPRNKVLTVKGLTQHELMPFDEEWVKENLHPDEIRLYAPYLRKNVLDRVYR